MKWNKDTSHKLSDDETTHTADRLRSGLDRLDELYPVKTPSLEWFQQMTLAEKQRQRRKLMFDLSTFMCVAVAFLSIYFVASNHISLTYLIVVHVVMAILPTIALLKRRWRSGDELYK